MLTLDASTAEIKFLIKPTKRLRLKRERLRKSLLHDVPVQWDRCLVSFSTDVDGVTAVFEDGSTAKGTVLVGVDGSSSRLRRLLAPENHTAKKLSISGAAVAVYFTPEQMTPMLELDPLLFLAIHPETNDFLWWSGN